MTIEEISEDRLVGYIPSLADVLEMEVESLSDINTFLFSVKADNENDAVKNAKSEMSVAFNINKDDIEISNVQEMAMLDSFDVNLKCTGKTNRFETVCWVPRTGWKNSVAIKHKSEDIALTKAMNVMEDMYNRFKDELSGKTIRIAGKTIRVPSLEDVGFECALNRTVNRCTISDQKDVDVGKIYSVIAINPVKQTD